MGRNRQSSSSSDPTSSSSSEDDRSWRKRKSSSDKTKDSDKTDHDQAKSIISYLDGKLEDIKNDLSKAKKPRLQLDNMPSFKSEGNKNQYSAILEIESQAKEALEATEQNRPSKAKKHLERILASTKKRKKLILMADTSSLGWSTANEYQKLRTCADDEADLRNITAAEERAARRNSDFRTKRKANQQQTMFNNSGFHQNQFNHSNQSNFAQQPRQMAPRQPFNFHPTQTRPRNNACFRCGREGHWSYQCYAKLNTQTDKSFTTDFSLVTTKGRLKKCLKYWEYIGASEFILSTIKDGYKIPFIYEPTPCDLKNNKSAKNDSEFVSKELLKLLKTGRIEKLSQKPKFINPLSVAIRNGKKRLILDLRHINYFVYKQKVKFDDWSIFQNFINKNGFLFTFDIKSGYHHVEIFHPHQKYLSFSWNLDGQASYFSFTVLPFGLTSGPYIFTKLLRPLIGFWRDFGIKIAVFIDDGHSVEIDFETCLKNSEFVRSSLAASGFLENEEKSEWYPKQSSLWLGVELNLKGNFLRIPDYRIDSLQNSLNDAKIKHFYLSARQLSKIAGKIISMKVVIGNISQLMTRKIYKEIDNRTNWDSNEFLSPMVISELEFWHKNLDSLNKKSLFVIQNPEVFSFSDASSVACGGFVLKDSKAKIAHKNWSDVEKGKSSTWRELTAIEFCLKSFSPFLHSKTVFWNTDNQAASIIVEKGSRINELQKIALNIFEISLSNLIKLKINWIPREENTTADFISKIIDYDDWSVSMTFFQYIDSSWGPHTIDRFANQYNRKIPRFNSRYWNPNTEAVDAFSQNWKSENNWLVPPISMISKTIKYLEFFKCSASLIIPLWKSAPFWPLLISNRYQFKPFVKEKLVFSKPNEFLKLGLYKKSLLGSGKFKSKIIALKIRF